MASLVADYSSTSEAESDEDSESDTPSEKSDKNAGGEKLPRPEFASSLKNSVFSNPFVEAENAKKAILEKHVKMTPTREEISMINGKKICWNFRKGRCRFGHNCKFAHDSDLQHSPSTEGSTEAVAEEEVDTITTTPENEIVADTLTKKKKRPGLTQGLVPSKKVMKMYAKQASGNR